MLDKYTQAQGNQINVNSTNEGVVPAVGPIDINLSDGVNPVPPISVSITGRTIDIVVSSSNDFKHQWVNPYSYCGTAANGTLETEPLWDITRIEVFENGNTDVKTATGEWTNRTTLTYT